MQSILLRRRIQLSNPRLRRDGCCWYVRDGFHIAVVVLWVLVSTSYHCSSVTTCSLTKWNRRGVVLHSRLSRGDVNKSVDLLTCLRLFDGNCVELLPSASPADETVVKWWHFELLSVCLCICLCVLLLISCTYWMSRWEDELEFIPLNYWARCSNLTEWTRFSMD